MHGVALVLGGAECVWRDAAAALRLCKPGIVVACNDAGADWPFRLDVWVTLHPEFMPRWQERRKAKGYNVDYETVFSLHTDRRDHPADHYVEHRWHGAENSGSSGLFAVKVALERAARVILAGMPVSASAGHFVRKTDWHDARVYQPTWEAVAPQFKRRVRSMSGWTRDYLGEPDQEWLAEATAQRRMPEGARVG